MNRFKESKACLMVLLAIFSLALSGCRKEDATPELLDPIYADLEKRATEAQKSYDDEIKNQDGVKAALEKAEPNTIELKNARRDLSKSEAKLLDFGQKALYYKIRAKRRLLVDRITYKEAFAKDQPWPDPHEYSDYQVNIRLREAPMNWSVHVPKLQDRLAKAGPSADQAKKERAKGEE
jgi:hypothetical protein